MNTRPRTVTVLLASLLAAGLLASCGSGSEAGSSADGTAETTAAGDGTGTTEAPRIELTNDTFPVTVEHEFGETEIVEKPERIVSVGYTEQDTLLALGIVPVGITDWYGDQPHGVWPWAQEALGDAEPELLSATDGFAFERIAALDPDLIIGTNAGMEAEDYEKLSAIAPTVAQPPGADGYFSRWDTQALLIGQAVGRGLDAEEIVDDVKDRFADVAAEHPEWAGRQAIFLQNAFYEGDAIAYQEGLSTEFLTDLGFGVPAELDRFVTEDGGQAYIPLEQLSVLDTADVLIWGTETPEDRDALEEEDLYLDLAAVEDDRLVFTDGVTAGAIYFSSPLSLPFVLDGLVPALERALGGDGPATIGG